MSVELIGGSASYLDCGGVVSSTPFTMACWVKLDTVSADQAIMSLTDSSSGVKQHAIRFISSANLTAQSRNGGSFANSTTTGSASTGTWTHVAGVWASQTSRIAYLNGTAATENTTSVTDFTTDSFDIGRYGDSSPSSYADGLIAYAAVWSAALSASEIASLAAGAHPSTISSGNLISVWELGESSSPSVDSVGANDLTWAASVSGNADNPTITITGIALTDLSNNRIFQRSVGSNNASITISGTYDGTPTAIQARIVEAGTSTEVVTWTTIDASPTGGTFSGSITVPADDLLYNAQVRFSNDTGVTDEGTNAWGVGMLVGICGQSNAENWFTDGTDETAHAALKSYAGSWADLSTTGNGAIAFGNALITEFGVAVGLLDYGVSGAALRSEADSGSGYWLDSTGGAPYPLFTAAVTAVGGSLEGIVWAQGERDARSGAVTEAEYESSFTTLISSFRSDVTNASGATNLPIFIQGLGRDTTGNDADTYAIRKAQYDVAATVADVYIGCHTVDLALSDTVHFSTAAYSKIGNRMALAFADILSNDTYHLGPVIASVSEVNSTTIDITLTHDGGSDFTPTSAITGFQVSEDSFSTTKTISAAARQDANTIRLTVATLTGPWELRYQYGANPTITGAVVDNTTLSLPLGPSFGTFSVGGGTAAVGRLVNGGLVNMGLVNRGLM